MNASLRALIFTLGAALAAVTAPEARADTKAEQAFEAQRLFSEALGLMKRKDFEAACPKLEQSQTLDPAMGTQFRLAECYEGTNRWVKAVTLYDAVAEAAKKEGRPDRAQQASDAAEKLRARVPTIVLHVPSGLADTPGLVIKRDADVIERPMWGGRVPADPGRHIVTAEAPGYERFSQILVLREADTTHLYLPPLFVGEAKPEGKKADEAPKDKQLSPLHLGLAIGAGVTGVGGIVTGSVFGAQASSSWSLADANCLEGAPRLCNADGVAAAADAQTEATVSTATFVVGGVGVAASVALFATLGLTATEPTVVIAPQPGGAAIVAGGRF